MAEQNNPYAAPAARVADAALPHDEGAYVEGGQKVGAGRGWGWIRDGFALFRESPGTWVLIIVVLFAILLAMSFVPLLNMLSSLLFPAFTGGLMLGCRALAQGDELEFNHLFEGFRGPLKPLLLVGLLYLAGLAALGIIAALAVGFGVFLGTEAVDPATSPTTVLLVALVVAALAVPLVMAVWFAPALVVFHDLSALAAMKESFAGCLKNIPAFLVYGVIAVVLMVLAAIPMMLGWLVLGPVLTASIYAGYRDVFLKP